MVDLSGVHGADDGNIINHATDVREEIGDLDATFTVFLELGE